MEPVNQLSIYTLISKGNKNYSGRITDNREILMKNFKFNQTQTAYK